MQQRIINMLAKYTTVAKTVGSSFSFIPFVNYLKNQLPETDGAKKILFESIIAQFESSGATSKDIPLEELENYSHLFDLIFLLLTDVTGKEENIYWGICLPMKPVMLYGTKVLYDVIDSANEYDDRLYEENGFSNIFLKSEMEHLYSFLMQQFYSFDLKHKGEFVRTVVDPHNGLRKHYSIALNTSFVVAEANRELPQLDQHFINNLCVLEDGVKEISQILPMDMFSFKGFTVTTITNISQQYALESLKNSIVHTHSTGDEDEFREVIASLQELIGKTDIGINLLPFTSLNNVLMDDQETYKKSLLLSSISSSKTTRNTVYELVKKFLAAPHILYAKDIEEEKIFHRRTVANLRAAGVRSYTLLPLQHNSKWVGAVELWSREINALDEQVLNMLEPAKELLGQILFTHLALLEVDIETIIREEYTRLQPAVQWKFTEAAWQRWQQKKSGTDGQQKFKDEIIFKNVFPLYGAVDIRNSTVERNAALLEDAGVQLDVLLSTLNKLKDTTDFSLLDQKIFQVKQWQEITRKEKNHFSQQEQLTDFFNHNVYPFLEAFIEGDERLKKLAAPYYKTINEQEGAAFSRRRELENSMKLVISAVNQYFDFLKDEIQTAYPCYFEKFRTDGVEYDIYIGQSISPHKHYNSIYLKNLRLMQLSSMAAIARYTHALLEKMSHPVETTQLIYIHAQPIDILFRNDEKRFDVEGAYNIRYHIIKKRIDKVHIKNSDERLTQPRKIALVYYSESEASEYISHIRYLQAENILNDDLERLELEELAGVRGLKALRVGVNLP